eukprot:4575643-Prymnesium_polylepis.1
MELERKGRARPVGCHVRAALLEGPRVRPRGPEVGMQRKEAVGAHVVEEARQPRRLVHLLVQPLHQRRARRFLDVVTDQQARRTHLEARVAHQAVRLRLRLAGRSFPSPARRPRPAIRRGRPRHGVRRTGSGPPDS